MDLVHSPDRIAFVRRRQGDVYADLVSISRALPSVADLQRGGVLRGFVREYVAHDADGNAVGRRKERVNDVDSNGAIRPAVITLLDVRRNVEVAGLTQVDALDCGYKTTIGLRDAWGSRHPRSPVCHVVYFAVGDVRDRPLFLNWTGRAGGDYVRSYSRAMDEAEALTPEQLVEAARWNKQKDDARRAQASLTLATETPSQRLIRLHRMVEQLGDEAASAVRQHLRVVEQRVDRAEGRVARDEKAARAIRQHMEEEKARVRQDVKEE